MTTTEAQKKVFVLEAFDTLFNKRDYAGAERFWSPAYIQHSAHIAPGREGLFDLVKAAPKELHYENALIVADGDYVMLHGRFSGIGQPVNWVVADILRIDNGLLAEHWNVIQDEATRESSKSGRPMFGDKFPPDRRPSPAIARSPRRTEARTTNYFTHSTTAARTSNATKTAQSSANEKTSI
jgi:predicted SnoaL-like aldol condensation-catalyzing enzyme